MSDERGAASIVVAAVTAAILVLVMGCSDAARVLAAGFRAQTAADAAALAAAQEQAIPTGSDPAETAAEFAGRNGADLVSCSCDPGAFETEVVVRVAVGDLILFGDGRVAEARARAVVDLPSG